MQPEVSTSKLSSHITGTRQSFVLVLSPVKQVQKTRNGSLQVQFNSLFTDLLSLHTISIN